MHNDVSLTLCRLSLRNPVAVVLNAITMAVGNINDAPLEMNALAIKDMRLLLPDLQARIMYHYRQEVLRQLYRILGSANFIGNPVGLFTNVSSGVADFFYEPFNGVVMHGNKDIGISIAKVWPDLRVSRDYIAYPYTTRGRPVSSRRRSSAFRTASRKSPVVSARACRQPRSIPSSN